MALKLETIVTPEEIMATPASPQMMAEMALLNREILMCYGQTIAANVTSQEQFVAMVAALTTVEYFLRKRGREVVQ